MTAQAKATPATQQHSTAQHSTALHGNTLIPSMVTIVTIEGMPSLYSLQAQGRVHVFDMTAIPWQATTNSGLWLKPVRTDDDQGHFLGLVRFDAFARSGLHQHRGVATSLVIQGGLTDYHGPIHLHEAGINILGSTHDAMAYEDTVLVSRLEAAVIYPPASSISGVHAGSRHEDFCNPDPSVAPEINVPGRENVWALGDSAAVPQPDGITSPPTAQHALRQAEAAPRLRSVASGSVLIRRRASRSATRRRRPLRAAD